ncbi:hypothetical protein HZS_7214 [Henneguya salminicola]|nr:hypothetical protein HZS_7214 [Henneguya salminicola]
MCEKKCPTGCEDDTLKQYNFQLFASAFLIIICIASISREILVILPTLNPFLFKDNNIMERIKSRKETVGSLKRNT